MIALPGLMLITAQAELSSTNRFAVNARVGFNIKGGFKYSGETPNVPVRTAPDGGLYNYDDGYVLSDSAGAGTTWYWGYDDKATQNDDASDQIVLNRTALVSDSAYNDVDGDVAFGGEMVYSRVYESENHHIFGVDVAIGLVSIGIDGQTTASEYDAVITDRFDYSAGANPPDATLGSPYQGSFVGPGFLINSAPSSSTENRGALASTYKAFGEIDGFLWSSRIGPFYERELMEHLFLHVAGGLSLGYLDVDVDWSTAAATPSVGSDRGAELLFGAFMNAEILWKYDDVWSIGAGLEFETLDDWSQTYDGVTFSLDFAQTYYATIGIFRDF